MKVLWLSRHEMTTDQIADLRRIYGEDVEVKTSDIHVNTWRDVTREGEDCDVFATVLPISILSDLVNPHNNTKPVIRAKSRRVPTGKMVVNPATGKLEEERAFQHVGWELVCKIEVVTELL